MSDLDKYAHATTGQPKSCVLTQTRAIAQLRACRPIPESQVRELCYKARELLIEEGNVVGVDAPVTVSLIPYPQSKRKADASMRRYAATYMANSTT